MYLWLGECHSSPLSASAKAPIALWYHTWVSGWKGTLFAWELMLNGNQSQCSCVFIWAFPASEQHRIFSRLHFRLSAEQVKSPACGKEQEEHWAKVLVQINSAVHSHYIIIPCYSVSTSLARVAKMWSVKYDFASISYGTWLNKQKRGLTTCGCDIWVVKEKLSVSRTSFRSSCLRTRVSLSTLRLFHTTKHNINGILDLSAPWQIYWQIHVLTNSCSHYCTQNAFYYV